MIIPDYLEEQKQFMSFLNELEQLFDKYDIDCVFATQDTKQIKFRKASGKSWYFYEYGTDFHEVHKFLFPCVDSYVTGKRDNIVTEPVKKEEAPTVAPAVIEPLENKPEPIKEDNMEDNTQAMGNLSYSEEAEPELTEQEINPKIEEYINDLADRLYATAKSMGFPKNVLGEYWTHPKVVMSVKKAGFNEQAYMIISANTTYWHKLADRMKLVELLDKQQEEQKEQATEPIAKEELPVVKAEEDVTPIDSYSTDIPVGTWTIKYSDYPESVYLDSKKGIDSICSKAYNWLLIYTRMHPELSPFPTRAMLCTALKDNMKKKQSFSYKWYEFVLEVNYDEPLESEELVDA